jgi:hypothetical protein
LLELITALLRIPGIEDWADRMDDGTAGKIEWGRDPGFSCRAADITLYFRHLVKY